MSALTEIRSRIESTSALVAQYQEAISSDPSAAPPSLYANVRSLERLLQRLDAEFQEAAISHGFELYRYRLLNEDDVPALAGVAEAWAKFQDFFDAIYTGLRKDLKKAERGKPYNAARPQLGYGYTFAGSIGVVVTLPHEAANLLGESVLTETSELIFDLIESRNLDATAKRLGPEPIQALHEWIEIHARNHFGVGLQWRSHDRVRRDIEVEYSQLARLQSKIHDTETKTISQFPGELFAVDHKKRTFSVRADDGKEISGVFDEDAISWEHAASVPARYRISIVTTTKIVVLGDEPKVTITLSALQDLQ